MVQATWSHAANYGKDAKDAPLRHRNLQWQPPAALASCYLVARDADMLNQDVEPLWNVDETIRVYLHVLFSQKMHTGCPCQGNAFQSCRDRLPRLATQCPAP